VEWVKDKLASQHQVSTAFTKVDTTEVGGMRTFLAVYMSPRTLVNRGGDSEEAATSVSFNLRSNTVYSLPPHLFSYLRYDSNGSSSPFVESEGSSRLSERLKAVTKLRRLVAGFPSGFEPGGRSCGICGGRRGLGQVPSEYFSISCQSSNGPNSGRGTNWTQSHPSLKI
jgi:hypothetical protein